MHTFLNAHLSFGLVNVPVGIAKAAGRKDVEFRNLHEKCIAPITQNKVCSACGLVLDQAEVVKGYEFAKGQFLIVEPDDLKQLATQRSKSIEITKFVPWDSVDEIAIEKSYYLVPNRDVAALAKPYTLLSKAMVKAEVAAVASSSLWGKESPAMIWPRRSGALALSILYCHDEVVSDSEIVSIMESAVPTEADLGLADEFIGLKAGVLNPQEDMTSHARERLQQYLVAKTSGVDFEFSPPDEHEISFDFMELLKESIQAAEKERVA